jgi:hypothetical protein
MDDADARTEEERQQIRAEKEREKWRQEEKRKRWQVRREGWEREEMGEGMEEASLAGVGGGMDSISENNTLASATGGGVDRGDRSPPVHQVRGSTTGGGEIFSFGGDFS